MRLCLSAVMVLAVTVPARAQDPVAYRVDVTAVAPRTAASSMTLRSGMFSQLFLESPADVLRGVPGLVIAQHAGGGKSDQYLIRGFDADHGTDILLAVDGVPVNMVSHAHGQGYADLHFVIPETVERVDVHKGPYYPEFGNLATAGAVQLATRSRFERPFVRLQAGSFGTARAVFGVSPRQADGWLAGELHLTDGPFRHPQDFTRANLAGKWRATLRDGHALTIAASGYRGQWHASGQIPARLVDSGRLDRFDAVDPSEGGRTTRAQAWTLYEGRLGNARISAQTYVVDYALDLFSNFTFFARDARSGDGILQRDRRTALGGRVAGVQPHRLGRFPAVAMAGADWRRDGIDVGLTYQQRRERIEDVARSDVRERDLGFYAQEEVIFNHRVRAIAGLRHDRFAFDVRARGTGPEGARHPSVTGPKASVIVSPGGSPDLQVFANYGRGFHSNDARAAVSSPTAPVLPASHGYEVGARRALGRRAEVSAAWWLLDLESEFTWVGDEGVTEAGGATRRRGVEVEARARLAGELWAEADVTASRGRYRETGELIARAPRFTMNAALVLNDWKDWSAQLRARHVSDHPAVEDGSVNAAGFTIADMHVRRALSPKWDVLVSVDNLFDASYREAQTFFPSRLAAEPAAVDDIHFTPGNPRAIRVGVEYRF
ncbi:MAG: TonB-dependent receptor [Acidimicrobiia bacterium]|nr:TonB-dependent receptor [Acidimicrobiia bacterium]